MSDYLMVPVKYSVLSVANKNERLVYVPVATTETAGIVRVGTGLKVDYYGLLSLSDDVTEFIRQVKSGDVVSKGFYEYVADFKYPKNSVVFFDKDFYVSLVDDNTNTIEEGSNWRKVGIRSQLEAKEVFLTEGDDVETAINNILKEKVDKSAAPYYIDNTQEGLSLSYSPNRSSPVTGSDNFAGVSIDENNITIEKRTGPTGRTTGSKVTFGSNRPRLEVNSELGNIDSPLSVLDDLNDLESAVDNKLSSKQDKKPNGTINLINDATGKLDNAYLPAILSGTSRVFAGTFGEDGVIVASAYASEINGQLITEINLSECVGYEFSYTGETPFLFDDIEVNKNDLIVCNGDKEPNWTLYDNSDKVVSVNGQTGAVQIDIPVGGIEKLVGTVEKPINFATDMEVGHLYSISGNVYLNSTYDALNVSAPVLVFKMSDTQLTFYGAYVNAAGHIQQNARHICRMSINAATGVYQSSSSGSVVNSVNGLENGVFKIYAPNTGGSNGTILGGTGVSQVPTWKTPAELGLATEESAHKVLVLGANGTIGTNANFVVSDAESYIPYRNNLTEFVFSGIIPVTGEVDLTKEVTIDFGDTSYYLFSAVDTSKRLTLGDLDFALRESLVTGYNYLFRTVFFENSDTVGFAVMPDKEDVLSLDSDEMDNYIADGGLPQGQLAICKKVITNGYTEGAIYRFKITYPSTYEWEELSGGGSKVEAVDISSGELIEADFTGTVHLTPKQFKELQENGSIVVGGRTFNSDDDVFFVVDENKLSDLTLTQNGTMLSSAETFTNHVQVMIEFETDGMHYGADFVLHPYDSSICLVSYKFSSYDGTAYLDESGHINISIPSGLTLMNIKGHYIEFGG